MLTSRASCVECKAEWRGSHSHLRVGSVYIWHALSATIVCLYGSLVRALVYVLWPCRTIHDHVPAWYLSWCFVSRLNGLFIAVWMSHKLRNDDNGEAELRFGATKNRDIWSDFWEWSILLSWTVLFWLLFKGKLHTCWSRVDHLSSWQQHKIGTKSGRHAEK